MKRIGAKEEYVAPVLEVLMLRVEHGYETSTFGVETEEIGDLEELI